MDALEDSPEPQVFEVFLLDESPIFIKGLAGFLSEQPRLQVAGYATNVAAGYQHLTRVQPDLLIMGINFSDGDGFQFIKTLSGLYPKLPILVCSFCSEMHYAERALMNGARGYITKDAPAEKILHAIGQVLSGEHYLSPKVELQFLRKCLNGKTPDLVFERLTPRELQVFELIGNGSSTSEIAKLLKISIKTVETYQAHIKQKANLKNSTQLAVQAARWVNLEHQGLPEMLEHRRPRVRGAPDRAALAGK